MRLRVQQLLYAAGGCVVLFSALLISVYHTTQGRWLDNAALEGFLSTVDDERRQSIADAIASLADPGPFLLIGFTIIAVALLKRAPRRAAAVTTLLVGASATSQILKPLLAKARFEADVVSFDHVVNPIINAPAFPSGHATAAMALALGAVMVTPRAWRPLVAAVGALFALAVGLAVVALAWHYPSDVVGGYLVASTWCLLTLAGLRYADERWPTPGTIRAAARTKAPTPSTAAMAIAATAAAVVTGITLARPQRLTDFAAAHTTATLAAIAISLTAAALVAAVSLVDQRPR
jgi:membrane-associated phospholipid phosphatase